MKHAALFILMNVVVIMLAGANTAWAYLDPGTGSMVLQLLLGGIAGAVVIFKLYWRRFVGLFRGKSEDEAESSTSDHQK